MPAFATNPTSSAHDTASPPTTPTPHAIQDPKAATFETIQHTRVQVNHDDDGKVETVLDALGDTWLGVVRWDPEKCSLGYHLVRTIEGRADKHRKHALAHHHDALGDESAASRIAESDASELLGDEQAPVTRLLASETMTHVRALAAKDKDVLRILDAYDAGCETKDEVLALAKMRSRTYHNAYGRLRRIVRHLTENKLATRLRA